ncbi:MAG: WD40 repeat domain-containing protein [Lentimicrobium sp.]
MTKRAILFLIIIISLAFPGDQSVAQDTTGKKILWTTDWSPDGKYVVIGGNIDTLKIYSSKNLQLYKSYPTKNTITCVKWHPFKNILAVGIQASSDKVRIINFETDRIIELEGISPDGARGIDWNYSGDLLAVADNDGQISIFETGGKLIRIIKHENTKSITSIDWHPKKNIFITVGDKIRIFDVDGKLLKTIVHRQEEVLLLSVAWHKTGDFFVTGDYGNNQNNDEPLLQFWTLNGDLIKSIQRSKGEYRNITWNSKGNRLATASDALRIWDTDGKLVSEGNSPDYLWGVAWNKKGNRIVTTSIEQRVIIRDNKGRQKMTIE